MRSPATARTRRVGGGRDETLVGNGNRYTLNEVWKTLQEIEGVEIAVRYGPWREGDVRESQADTTAARRDLGHDPQYTLEQGLRRTLAWYRGAGTERGSDAAQAGKVLERDVR